MSIDVFYWVIQPLMYLNVVKGSRTEKKGLFYPT